MAQRVALLKRQHQIHQRAPVGRNQPGGAPGAAPGGAEISGAGGITGTGSATIVLERSTNGTTWTQIGTMTLSGSGSVFVDGDPAVKDIVNWGNSGSITVTDNTAATSTMYLRGRITARTLPTFNGTAKTSIVETQSVGVVSTE